LSEDLVMTSWSASPTWSAHINININININIQKYKYKYAYINICIHIHTYAYICIYIYTWGYAASHTLAEELVEFHVQQRILILPRLAPRHLQHSRDERRSRCRRTRTAADQAMQQQGHGRAGPAAERQDGASRRMADPGRRHARTLNGEQEVALPAGTTP
jgi:hypothetical protein